MDFKEDTGTESNTEKEKGIASDSFKRACVNWGIGRELYTSPFIWVSADRVSMFTKNGKYATKDNFSVEQIDYDDARRISALVIVNQHGNVVFAHRKKAKAVNNITQTSITTDKIVCASCGNEIKSIKTSSGAVKSPQEVAEGCGGLCWKCYKSN